MMSATAPGIFLRPSAEYGSSPVRPTSAIVYPPPYSTSPIRLVAIRRHSKGPERRDYVMKRAHRTIPLPPYANRRSNVGPILAQAIADQAVPYRFAGLADGVALPGMTPRLTRRAFTKVIRVLSDRPPGSGPRGGSVWRESLEPCSGTGRNGPHEVASRCGRTPFARAWSPAAYHGARSGPPVQRFSQSSRRDRRLSRCPRTTTALRRASTAPAPASR
jgi:hypothetical protein